MTDYPGDKEIADAMDRIPVELPSPAMVAYLVIQDVMRRNAEAHIAAGDIWEERSEEYHIYHAHGHMYQAYAKTTHDDLPGEAVEDAENTICRLAFALALRRKRV